MLYIFHLYTWALWVSSGAFSVIVATKSDAAYLETGIFTGSICNPVGTDIGSGVRGKRKINKLVDFRLLA